MRGGVFGLPKGGMYGLRSAANGHQVLKKHFRISAREQCHQSRNARNWWLEKFFVCRSRRRRQPRKNVILARRFVVSFF